MVTLGKENNFKFVPEGNKPEPGIITPKSNKLANRTDVLSNESSDPSHK